MYDEPPSLPPRPDDFLDLDQPQAFTPQIEEPGEDYENIDGGEYVDITEEESEYEDIGVIPPPPGLVCFSSIICLYI